MKASRHFGSIVVLGLGLSLGLAGPALAQKKPKPTPAEQAPAAEPPVTKNPIPVNPQGITWGMTPKALADFIDKLLEKDYAPAYKKASPGVQTKALDAQLAEEKSIFRRSRIDFGKLPTSLDAGPLKGEFTYQNQEALMTYTHAGQTTHFFFIQDKLWKIVEEAKLGEGAAGGKDFQTAVVKLAEKLGVPGRVLKADAAKNRAFTEVDWKDAASHLRAQERSETAMALVTEDLGTLGRLADLRKNKQVDDTGIDPAVAAAMRKPDAPTPPPTDNKKPAKPTGKK